MYPQRFKIMRELPPNVSSRPISGLRFEHNLTLEK